jgi:hypothetical protein
MAEITGDLHSLYFEGMEKTHPKILNPHSFPLPRPGHLILSGNVHKEVRRVAPLPCSLGACLTRSNRRATRTSPSNSALCSSLFLQMTAPSCAMQKLPQQAGGQCDGKM